MITTVNHGFPHRQKEKERIVIQRFDLQTVFPIDSMHDQVITCITATDNKVEFHFNELSFSYMADYSPARPYFESHREFHSCDVVFSEPDSPYAVIYQEKQSSFRGQFLSLCELTAFLDAHDCRIEVFNLLCGYELIVFQGTFINRKGHYCDKCIIYVPAKGVEYVWK